VLHDLKSTAAISSLSPVSPLCREACSPIKNTTDIPACTAQDQKFSAQASICVDLKHVDFLPRFLSRAATALGSFLLFPLIATATSFQWKF
jgi:hypothetical protein